MEENFINHIHFFQDNDLNLTEEQKDRFNLYFNELMDHNKKINLTSHRTGEEIVRKNFIDSLTCLQSDLDFSNKKIIDLGSGGGFPGIPIKIMKEDTELHLVESTGKKADFLELVIKKLGLLNTYVRRERIENLAHEKNFREKFHIVFARALATLPVLLEYALPFMEQDGIFIAQKGKKYQEEIDLSSKTLNMLGGKIERIVSVKIPGEFKKLILIKKIFPTPDKYPRKAGIPVKRPLIQV